jgi:hypothetical protein
VRKLCLASLFALVGCTAAPSRKAQELAAGEPKLARSLAASTLLRSDGYVSSRGWRDAAHAPGYALGLRLPDRADGDLTVGIGRSARYQLRLRVRDARPGSVVLDRGLASYSEVLPGVDEIVTASTGEMEAFFLLRGPESTRTVSYDVTVSDGIARVVTGNGLTFVDERGAARLRMPLPFAIDAAGRNRAASLAWSPRPGGGTITVAVDTTGLRFPVLLDPAIQSIVFAPAGGPSPAVMANTAFDSARQRVVLYFEGATWEWDGTTWLLRTISGPSRFGVALAYDSIRHRTVLFGDSAAAQTWDWDGTTWIQRMIAGPSARSDHAMAFDSKRGVVVLFGGFPGSGETWEFDGSTWTNRTAATAPPGRIDAGMAYDSARGRTVLFGGSATPSGTTLGDTWEWDGTTWAQVCANGGCANGAPATRYSPAMTFDSKRGRTVMFGGVMPTSTIQVIYGDTWEWNGGSWTRVATAGPAPRFAGTLAYDSARATSVLFGAAGGDGTWGWDGSTWTHLQIDPEGRTSFALAFDSARGRTVMFGGHVIGNTSITFGDTWEWDGVAWQLRAATGPPARESTAMAFDSLRGKTVLFGGSNGAADTWEWNGTSWSQPMPPTSPSARRDHAMTYDTTRGRTLLHGGALASNSALSTETWEWSGSAWSKVSSNGPPRDQASLAYDGVRHRAVLFGGVSTSGGVGETWEWDGTSWSQVCTMIPCNQLTPGAYDSPPMAFDSRRGVSVLLETDASGIVEWEWSGTAWASQLVLPFPAAGVSAYGQAVYDSVRGRTVLLDDTVLPYGNSLWESHAHGESCASAGECDTGFCVDGVCCEQSACGVCQSCNGTSPGQCASVTNGPDPDSCPGAKTCDAAGACKSVQGVACAAGSECASTFCADGVCCDGACASACDVCAQALGASADGTCTPAPKGSAGSPACTAYLCDGSSVGCATVCVSDTACTPDHYCAADGTCRAQKGPAAACNDLAGADCLNGKCRVCATAGGCADGFCCAQPCAGACDVCAMALGAIADGTCSTAPKGYAGAPACAPYVCAGTSTGCPTSCADGSFCAAGLQCSAGQCAGALPLGAPCNGDGDCASNHCADGVCCDSACLGKCIACNLPSAVGMCHAAPPGTDPRHDCVGDPGCPGSCNGALECGFVVAGTPCDVCKTCNATGRCNAPNPGGDDPNCNTISCALLSTECVRFDDLTTGRCVSAGLCAQPNDPATCTRAANAPDGTACAGGTCHAGVCQPTAAAPTPNAGSSSGCASAGALHTPMPAALLWFFLALLVRLTLRSRPGARTRTASRSPAPTGSRPRPRAPRPGA